MEDMHGGLTPNVEVDWVVGGDPPNPGLVVFPRRESPPHVPNEALRGGKSYPNPLSKHSRARVSEHAQLAITMELDSTDASMELGRSSDPNISLQSRRHSYLQEIRSLAVDSAGGWSPSSSSRSARSSSYYSSSKSSSSRHRYAPYSISSSRRLARLEDKGPRDIARRMVRDGFMGKLIGEFGRAPRPALERWFSELDVGWVLRSALEKEKSELALDKLYDLAVQRWTRGFTVMTEALSATQRHLQE
uniref:Uncharacterized protein n=1 Tax=Oryza nivara TaxID=4536 RepID=A0A0E0HDI5_ORYNI